MIKLRAPRKYAWNVCAERSPGNIYMHSKRSRRFNWRSKSTLRNLGWNNLNSRAKSHELYVRVCMKSTRKVQIPVNDAWQRTPAVHCVSWELLTKSCYLFAETVEEHVTLLSVTCMTKTKWIRAWVVYFLLIS